MKKLYTLLTVVILTTSAMAQAPEKMSYQAVVRDAGNALITSQAVGMQLSILQGSVLGTEVYVEKQTPTTNINGLVSLEIGSGIVVSGTFNSIDWSNGPYFIKTETDPTGGTTYTITGTNQLMSVPYALHANTADSIVGGVSITETDPVYGVSVASSITTLDTTNWNNKLDSEIDGDTTNEIQDIYSVLNQGQNAGGNSLYNVSQLAVGISSFEPDAVIDISTSGKALLLSQLSNSQRDALTAEPGMIIYNTTTKDIQAYIEADNEELDQQCPITDQAFRLNNSQSCGQSFRPGKSGVLSKILVSISAAVNSGNFTFKLYSGLGMSGTLLHSQTVSLSPAIRTITLSTPVNVIKGSNYTFQLSTAGSEDVTIEVCSYDYYNDGKKYRNASLFGTYDLWFRTFITPSAQWINLEK